MNITYDRKRDLSTPRLNNSHPVPFPLVAGMRPLDRYAFDCRGWLLLEGVLDRSTVRALREAVDAQELGRPGPTLDRQRFSARAEMLGWHWAFRQLLDHPVVLAVLGDLIGPWARLDHAYGIMMAPGTSGLGVHGPSEPFDPAQYYLWRGGRPWCGLVAFSWSLVDGRPGEGGFGCISGSHRAGADRPPGAEDLVQEVPQPAGSLLVFSEALVHCTLPWKGQVDRYALIYKYSPGNSAWGPPLAVPADVRSVLTDRQRLMLEGPYVEGRRPVT